jgi:hypothetical protein
MAMSLVLPRILLVPGNTTMAHRSKTQSFILPFPKAADLFTPIISLQKLLAARSPSILNWVLAILMVAITLIEDCQLTDRSSQIDILCTAIQDWEKKKSRDIIAPLQSSPFL